MKTSYLFLTTGFEEIEAMATIDILRRANINLVTVSVEKSLEVTGAHNVIVKADTFLADNKYDDADILILPGGTVRLGEIEELNQILVNRNKENKLIAAICAAPSILGNLNIIDGKEATCYPGFQQYISKATNVSADREVEDRVMVSHNIITGKGPGCTFEFALKIVEVLLGKDIRDSITKDLIV